MNEGMRDLKWLRGLCDELQWEHETPILVSDSQGAIFITAKPGKHSKSKHIENKYHYVWHLVEDGALKTRYCPTDDMTADIMTKALGRVKFEKIRTALGVVSVSDYTARN